MNIHDIQSCFTLVCAVGGIVCIAAILLYSARHQLRRLFDRWLALGHLGQCVSLLMLTVFVLYGGSKPGTNEVEIVGGEETNEVEIVGGGGQSNLTSCSFGLQRVGAVLCPPPPLLSTLPATPSLLFTTVTNWTARGAWNDWRRINFPDGFAFPCGTNLLSSVTLMSYGEIRENLRCSPSAFTSSLPHPVSLEPGVSTCAYGLTASNSYLFVWENACVEREATNRVDAAIELFASGDVQVRFGDSATNIVARPPEGFVGIGQDTNWLAAAFPPNDFAAITNKGYETWLQEDCVGHNEPNGRYKLSVTVAALPDQGPCYLVCGPYKMVVTSPGIYSFPLMDLTEYELYTCPTAVPLTWEMDDGWDSPESDYAPLYMSAAPRMLGAPRNNGNHYTVVCYPEVYIRPNYVTREEAMREAIELRCNASGIAARDYRSWSGQAIVRYLNHSEAVLEECLIQDGIYFYYELNGKRVGATLYINPNYNPWWHDPDPTNGNSSASSTNGNSSASNP